MNIGERIKQRRKELELSVDDVADRLNKNRATIYRYESNDIENLPITILEPLSEILQTTPAYLMGWDIEENVNTNIDVLRDELELLNHYRKLNDLGKKEASKRVLELNCIPMYSKENEEFATLDNMMFTTIAAHDDNLTEDEKKEADKRILEALKKRQK